MSKIKVKGQKVQKLERPRTDGHTNATKHIISLASCLIKNVQFMDIFLFIFLGGREGWADECDDVFIGKKKEIRDYHSEMNSEHFSEWFLERLLPGQYIVAHQAIPGSVFKCYIGSVSKEYHD